MVSHNIKRLPNLNMVTIFLMLRYNLTFPFLVADHLLFISDKCLEKYSTGCHSLSISYSKIAPVAKPEVSARTLLGKVGSKMLRTGA